MGEESAGEFDADPFEAMPDPAVVYEYDAGRPVVRTTNAAFDRTFEAGASPGDPLQGLPGAASFADDPGEAPTTITREVGDERRSFRLRASEVDEGGVVVYAEVTNLRDRLERARTQRDRLDEFAGTLAHDLRNPLEVASARTELARELGGDEHLAKAEGALARMDEVITELLSLAREGAVVGETDPVSLSDCARDAWDTVATSDATLTVEAAVTATADRTRLRELLENCFHNAVSHGGDAVAVRVGAVVDDGRTVGFFVADDGPGIPPEDRPDVFDPGVTTADDGTGFGLTVVDRIAAGHGWDVSVGESAGGGARFEVVDPAGTAFSSD